MTIISLSSSVSESTTHSLIHLRGESEFLSFAGGETVYTMSATLAPAGVQDPIALIACHWRHGDDSLSPTLTLDGDAIVAYLVGTLILESGADAVGVKLYAVPLAAFPETGDIVATFADTVDFYVGIGCQVILNTALVAEATDTSATASGEATSDIAVTGAGIFFAAYTFALVEDVTHTGLNQVIYYHQIPEDDGNVFAMACKRVTATTANLPITLSGRDDEGEIDTGSIGVLAYGSMPIAP